MKRLGRKLGAALNHMAAGLAGLRPSHIPIAYKMALTISVLLVVGMATLGSVIIYNETQLLRSQSDAFGRTVVAQTARSAQEPLLADDGLGLSVLVDNLSADPTILGTAIIDAQGSIPAQSGITPFEGLTRVQPGDAALVQQEFGSFEWRWQEPEGRFLKVVSYTAPIRFKDVTAGHALVTFSRFTLDQALHKSLHAILAATVLLLAAAIFLSFVIGKRMTRPIYHLMDASRAIDEGHYHYRINERRNDEIGELINSFNAMAEGLLQKNQVESTFSRFVSPSIAKQILRDLDQVRLGGEHVRGSVLFADIVGYTQISRHMSPTETAELLNEYFTYIAHASQLYHGNIDKFMGDCAMIVFGVPEQDPEHSFHAIACAVLIQKLMRALNGRRKAEGLFPVEFRIGINSGEMLAGNLGSHERMQYTVVGDTVNMASRLCTFAGTGQIVVTSDIYDEPNIKDRVVAIKHNPINLRSHPVPVATYLVQDLSPTFRLIMRGQLDEILARRAVA